MGFDSNLVRGSIDLVVLAAMAEGETYGYAILKRIHDASFDQHALAAGTLYPILHRLEQERCIASRWDRVGDRKRKWYRLTDRGRRRLQDDARAWKEFSRYVNGMLAPALRGA